MKAWSKKRVCWFQDLKYRKKMNLVLILVGLLPLSIVSVFMIRGFRNMLTDKELESMGVSLNQTCDTIDRQVEIYANLLNYVVFDNELQDILEREETQDYQSYNNYVNIIDPILTTPKFYHDGISRLTIYSDSVTISHDVTLAPLEEIREESWFEELRNTPSGIWVWPDEGRDEILLIRKFPGYRETEAYLGLYCDLKSLMEPLYFFKKDGSGIILADEQDQILYSQSYLENTEEITSIEEIEANYPHMKRKIENLPLYTCIYMDKSSVYSGFHQTMGTVIWVVVICLAVIIIISGSMSRLLVKRIEHLTTCINQVESGNMEIDIEDNSSDEIGVLIRSFRNMLDQIQRLITEVYESKITQQKLEMTALQAQINPHFLYNTLSLINWKAISVGEDDISMITLALSDYYRTTLNKGDNFITVSGEMVNIQSYLAIQLIMHDYEFDVKYHVDSSLGEYRMPKLILQPLIENALEHGLDVKEEGEKKIIISCQQNEKDIIWTVEDTGVGMDKETAQNLIKTHATGYGVKNVNDRLALLYGEDYELYIESCPGEGTKVTIHIPKRSPSEGRGGSDEQE